MPCSPTGDMLQTPSTQLGELLVNCGAFWQLSNMLINLGVSIRDSVNRNHVQENTYSTVYVTYSQYVFEVYPTSSMLDIRYSILGIEYSMIDTRYLIIILDIR